MRKSLALSLAAVLMTGSAAIAQGQMNLFIWSDYMAEDTVSNFEKETGLTVNFAFYDKNESVDTALLSGSSGYDIVVPSGNFLERQIKAGLILPLDKSLLPNLANLDPKAMENAAAIDPDNAHGVPYMINTIGLGYNVEKVTAALGADADLETWNLLFDPAVVSKLADCGVAILDSQSEVVGIALNYLGLDPNSESTEDLAKAQDLLVSIKPYIRYYSSSLYIDDLANGEICLALGYSGDVFIAADNAAEGIDVQYAIPREGAATLFDFLAIPADAPNPENAHKFINYILEPKVVADITNTVFYANPNPASLEFVDEEVKSNPSIYPSEETLAKAFTLKAHSPEYEELLTRAWTFIRTGQ